MRGRGRQRGIAAAYVGITLFTLLGFVGLAVDLGRAYVVKTDLSKAVDAAALAAAKYIGSGEAAARNEAQKIFNVNFPDGHLGVSSVENPPSVSFSTVQSGANAGATQIDVSSTAVLSTAFMRVAGYNDVTVAAAGQSTRRLVDMAFVIDRSQSLQAVYPQVKSAATQFIQFFDPNVDRIALVFFSSDTTVAEAINTSGRGFNQSNIVSRIDASAADGCTATAEGLYRGWDQLRSVPSGIQSGLRVVVLFTDGAPNSFSGTFRVHATPGSSTFVNALGSLHTKDFAPPAQSFVEGLYPATSASDLTSWPDCIAATRDSSDPHGHRCYHMPPSNSSSPYTSPTLADIPWLPTASTHAGPVSAGIPTSFFLIDNALTGGPGSGGLANRPLTPATPSGGTPPPPGFAYNDNVRSAANASRNLTEIVANAIRSDGSGPQPIHIYVLGLGDLLTTNEGPESETGSSILLRVANDPSAPSYNDSQPEGRYYFVGDASQLNAAFALIRDQIIRISQ